MAEDKPYLIPSKKKEGERAHQIEKRNQREAERETDQIESGTNPENRKTP